MSIRPSNEHLLKWVKSVYFPQAALAEAGMSLELDSAVGERLKFGEFELAPVARALWRRGEQVRLGSRALDILIALASRPGQIVSKDDLTQLVWRGAFVDETALRVGISAVRKALGLGGDRYIGTVPGRGYCFVLDVETTPAKPTAEPPQIERLKPQRLPAQIARVVGRDEVIATLAAEGTRRRLLSLVGAGGIGKTTVAVAVADRLRADLDAVAFVDLAPIENGTQMSAAAAAALGINLRLDEDRVDQIAVAVEDRRVLIVLDNCEHLVDAAAAFVEALLSSARGVTILATSRERLRAAGEWVHQLSPLEAPPESPTVSAEEVRGYPAVELFEERAAFALGGYQISDTDAPYVAEICRRLDGIALAIELAAGRLAGFGVQALANSLKDCFSILTHGRRTALPRHQTLRATLDWSYRLLSPEDQAALRCLSVFNGSFTLEDAAFLMGPLIRFGETNDRLTSLLDKSLVVARPEERTFRYRLLDTTRAYGQDKLEESGEANPQRRRHAQRFLQVCRASIPDEEGQSSLRQATADIRAALDWSLVRDGDLSLGVDLASAATPVFLRLSLLREHKKYLDLALGHISASANTAPISDAALRSEMALRTAIALALYYTEGSETASEDHLQKARAIAQNTGDTTHELKVLWMLYGIAGNSGNYRKELAYAKMYDSTARASVDVMAEFRRHRILGRSLGDLGRHVLAREHLEMALRANRASMPRIAMNAYEIDDWIAARATLARILWLQGLPDDAKREADQCIGEAMQLGHEQTTCWVLAFNICPLAIWRGRLDEANVFVDLLLERSQRVFEHYHEWGLLYRQFLAGAKSASGQVDAVCHSDVKANIAAQVDLFATFDSAFAGPDQPEHLVLQCWYQRADPWRAMQKFFEKRRVLGGIDAVNGVKVYAVTTSSALVQPRSRRRRTACRAATSTSASCSDDIRASTLTSLRRMVSSIGGDSSRKPSASSSPTWLAASIGQG
jgi:predicted ATPase/DNA-binding winged helix-turn-helix (wHTH) protein